MNTFCDWLFEIIVISVYDSFFGNYISIVLLSFIVCSSQSQCLFIQVGGDPNCSVSTHNLQYTEFYGDGDSKSFSVVEDIYKKDYGKDVQKKECVGHVQKRLGTALRKLKKETKGLGGKGKHDR